MQGVSFEVVLNFLELFSEQMKAVPRLRRIDTGL